MFCLSPGSISGGSTAARAWFDSGFWSRPPETFGLSRTSPMARPSCSRACSERKRILAALWMALRACHWAHPSSWKSFWKSLHKKNSLALTDEFRRTQPILAQTYRETMKVRWRARARCLKLLCIAITTITSSRASAVAHGKEASMNHPTSYRTIQVDGLSIFYREAGPKEAPTILLLHGLPSSSRMFEPLFSRLSDRYHLVAPDYPGFGHSDWPDPKKFAYTFDHIAEIMSRLTEALGIARYTLYMHDYGGPVGFRMALAHPDRVEALIVQDA